MRLSPMTRRLRQSGAYTEGKVFLSHFINFVRIPALAARQSLLPLPRLRVLEPDRLSMHVWPQDIDLNLHMNNARYLSIMDYARTHLLARTQLLQYVVRERWQPLVGSAWMTYRRSLPLFASFSVTSRLACWDDRWFYIEQVFAGAAGIAAIGWVKGMLREERRNLDPKDVLARVAPGIESPPMPAALSRWNELIREQLQPVV
jgi:acyl-CoA thioesterase FadM